MIKVVPEFLGCVEVADGADSPPQLINSAGADAAEMSLELGESHLDGIEIGAVATVFFDGGNEPCVLPVKARAEARPPFGRFRP